MRTFWINFTLFSLAGLLIAESSVAPESVAKSPFLATIQHDLSLVSRFVHDHSFSFSPKASVVVAPKLILKQQSKVMEKFSPVDNAVVYSKTSFDSKLVGEKSTLEKIYTPEFTRQMQEHYQANVAPQEKIATDPFHHVAPWEEQAYEDQRRDMARWTARQALNDRINNLFSKADPNSGAMRIMHAVKSLNGEDDVGAPKKTAASDAAKGTDANAAPVATSQAMASEIPTKVKAKLNVLKGQGQVNFSNPVVITSLNVDVNSAIRNSTTQTLTAADDPVRLDMSKEFKSIDLSSGLQYGFEKQVASFNVTKKLSDHISCVASSDQYTGEQRNADGTKGQQILRMNYSLSF